MEQLKFVPHPKVTPIPARSMDMKVLCLGRSRTGTMSLYLALNRLGYKTYHMVEASLDSANGSLDLWQDAMRAKVLGQGQMFQGSDFDRMLWKYDAVTDIPCAIFVDELLAAYPDAKVVLNHRSDPAKWVASIQRTFHTLLSWKSWAVLGCLDKQWTAPYITILRLALHHWTNGRPSDTAALRRGYLAHNQHIRGVVPPDRLLEFRAEQGWEPLCQFLGKEVPEGEAYPFVNEGDFAVKLHEPLVWWRVMVVGGWVALALARVLVTMGVGAVGVWWFGRS